MDIDKGGPLARQLSELFETKAEDIRHFILVVDTPTGVKVVHTLPSTWHFRKALRFLYKTRADDVTAREV